MCGVAREILPLVTSPLLVFQSVNDPVVPKACADEIMASCGSASKRVVWLEESYHISQLDLDRDLIVAAALDFARTAIPA
jgi:carboxylesterase